MWEGSLQVGVGVAARVLFAYPSNVLEIAEEVVEAGVVVLSSRAELEDKVEVELEA